MSLPEPLRYTVGLIDQISKPLGNIQREFNSMASSYRDGTHTMVAGAAGVAGVGITLQQALMPAIEMDRALGEVKALGVADDALKAITQTAFEFSAEFGKSSVDVVRHAEGVRLAMGNMPADVMASVTHSSATLSMAMKSDAESTTRFMKNLYGNYKTQADAMGVDTWTAQIAGMTATAKQLYGIEMGAIEGMVDGMHSLTSTMGVGLSEQFAVFGMLKGQMSEGDAVTQYTNFLENAVGAQDKLGVSLTDMNGQLLPMQQVLENIAPLLDGLSGTEARTLLDEAGLGDGALMLTNLVGRMGEFSAGMDALGNVKGLDAATQMAADMTDQWERMEQGVFAIRAAFGTALLPSLMPVISSLVDGAGELIRWTNLFPNITRWVGYLTLGFFGLVAVGGVLTIMTGAFKMLWATVTLGSGLVKTITFSFGFLGKTLTMLRGPLLAMNMYIRMFNIRAKVAVATQWILNIAMTAASAFYSTAAIALSTIGKAFLATAMTALKFAAAVAMNPLFWIPAAIAGVVGLMYYWDDLKASFGDTAWFQVLTAITAPIRALFAAIYGGWKWVTSGFTDLSGFDGLFAIVDEVKAVFENLFGWIGESFDTVISWIPGLGDDEAPGQTINAVQQATPKARVQQGGVARQMSTYNQGRSTNYGGVSIYPTYMNSPQDMANELEMAAP
ncbi:phage tail tape measure protein [Vibrio scophthalmi]|uniref:Phage tail tape measure protein domain-containing protein n=1 Tax=Vibrio scophthalmi LMG 19158 TaxID=870967 RepID=F9RKS7_9VIBR|nr:phage tail tape measure protein [Vibrio scophthalmi]EGU39401.1 hypothetical protein VIS19158_03886 [Vibrio scophthalmi LMG 19158]